MFRSNCDAFSLHLWPPSPLPGEEKSPLISAHLLGGPCSKIESLSIKARGSFITILATPLHSLFECFLCTTLLVTLSFQSLYSLLYVDTFLLIFSLLYLFLVLEVLQYTLLLKNFSLLSKAKKIKHAEYNNQLLDA